jgi:hypothetical protein
MTEISRGFLQALRENTETDLKLGHSGFPPYRFQIIIRTHSELLTATDSYSVVMQQ